MPIVIKCNKCGGQGIVNVGMSWREAINVAETILENPNFLLENVIAKFEGLTSYYIVVLSTSTNRYEVRSMSEFLDIARQVQMNIDRMKEENKNATSDTTDTNE